MLTHPENADDLPHHSKGSSIVANTPSDLLAMRTLLGMSQGQLADLLGTTGEEVRNLEKIRTSFIYLGHSDLLEDMLARMNALLLALTDESLPPPEFLFVYPNDDVFAEMDPSLHGWMKFNTVHQMFTARLLDEWTTLGYQPTIAAIAPAPYAEYLALHSGVDSDNNRIRWIRAHMRTITFRDGMPRQKGSDQ